MSSIQLVGISKDWSGTKALDAIDLTIAAGSFCVLLGPSGCGKSTTLRIIAGLESATSGQVFVDGKDVTHQPPKFHLSRETLPAAVIASSNDRWPSG